MKKFKISNIEYFGSIIKTNGGFKRNQKEKVAKRGRCSPVLSALTEPTSSDRRTLQTILLSQEIVEEEHLAKM